MVVDELMSLNLIDLNVDAHTKNEAFEHIAIVLKEEGYIDEVKGFIDNLYEREKIESTNLIDKIAIPHSKSDVIRKSSISLLRFINEVDWEDGKEFVKVAFVLAVSPYEKNITHLEAIAALATLLLEEEFIKILLNSNSKKEILEYIKQEIGG